MTTEDMLAMKAAAAEEKEKEAIEENGLDMTIDMSTEGNLYAPKVVHLRNFTTDEVLQLGLTAQEEIYQKVVQLLKAISDIPDPAELSERELDEILVKLYFNYYGEKIELAYALDDEDIRYQKTNLSEDLYKQWRLSVEQDAPTVTYTADSVTYNKNPSKKYKIAIHPNGHTIVYKILKIKEIFMLQDFMDKKYGEIDRKYNGLQEQLDQRDVEIELKGSSTIKIPAEIEDAYKQYLNAKVVDNVKYTEYLSICKIDDTDLSNDDLEKKFDFLEKKKLNTFKTFNTASYGLSKIPYGPSVGEKFVSPISGKEKPDYYPFRLDAVISAYSRVGSSRYDYDAV